MATKNKKIATAVTAVTLAAVLAVGGTMAWQSISQEATNIVTSEVNPGGRLHDDFDGSNDKNIYVENFGTQNIYARVKLSEYLEIGENAGKFGDDIDRDDVQVYLGEEKESKDTYTTYIYGQDNLSDEYWSKEWGGETLYIPTFNMNQDSLAPDLNGTYEYKDGDEPNPYGDFIDYNGGAYAVPSEDEVEGVTTFVTGDEVRDKDSNADDEGKDAVEGENIETTVAQAHNVAQSIYAEVISMDEYTSMNDEDKAELQAWVYDIDGWAYWSQPIAPDTATGLLLNSITDLDCIDEDYYYAIHVTGQFITAGDLKNGAYGGFFKDGEEPTDDALELLDSIGVNTGGESDGDSVHANTIPAGATYYIESTDTTLHSGQSFPAVSESGDIYTYGGVQYGYNMHAYQSGAIDWSTIKEEMNGWGVMAEDYEAESFEAEILSEINGASVVEMQYAFKNCKGLTSVTIPEGIKETGYEAFYGCTSLTSVEIPDTVTTISGYSFNTCSNLSSLDIPSSVTSIGNAAFQQCDSLTSVTIPGNVETIGQSAFWGCDNLENVTIQNGVKEIGNGAFSNDIKLTTVTIAESVETIGARAFETCKALTSVTIPSGVTVINESTFNGCTSLASVVIPEGVIKIGDGAFQGCTSLTEVEIPEGVIEIGHRAFYNCTGLKTVTLPSTLTTMRNNVFNNCSSLESIDIPEGVQSIGQSAFYGCTSLEKVTIPSTVTEIMSSAFNNCTSLETVTIPENVTIIGNNAFYGCINLTSVYFEHTEVPSFGGQCFFNISSDSKMCTFYFRNNTVAEIFESRNCYYDLYGTISDDYDW